MLATYRPPSVPSHGDPTTNEGDVGAVVGGGGNNNDDVLVGLFQGLQALGPPPRGMDPNDDEESAADSDNSCKFLANPLYWISSAKRAEIERDKQDSVRKENLQRNAKRRRRLHRARQRAQKAQESEDRRRKREEAAAAADAERARNKEAEEQRIAAEAAAVASVASANIVAAVKSSTPPSLATTTTTNLYDAPSGSGSSPRREVASTESQRRRQTKDRDDDATTMTHKVVTTESDYTSSARSLPPYRRRRHHHYDDEDDDDGSHRRRHQGRRRRNDDDDSRRSSVTSSGGEDERRSIASLASHRSRQSRLSSSSSSRDLIERIEASAKQQDERFQSLVQMMAELVKYQHASAAAASATATSSAAAASEASAAGVTATTGSDEARACQNSTHFELNERVKKMQDERLRRMEESGDPHKVELARKARAKHLAEPPLTPQEVAYRHMRLITIEDAEAYEEDCEDYYRIGMNGVNTFLKFFGFTETDIDDKVEDVLAQKRMRRAFRKLYQQQSGSGAMSNPYMAIALSSAMVMFGGVGKERAKELMTGCQTKIRSLRAERERGTVERDEHGRPAMSSAPAPLAASHPSPPHAPTTTAAAAEHPDVVAMREQMSRMQMQMQHQFMMMQQQQQQQQQQQPVAQAVMPPVVATTTTTSIPHAAMVVPHPQPSIVHVQQPQTATATTTKSPTQPPPTPQQPPTRDFEFEQEDFWGPPSASSASSLPATAAALVESAVDSDQADMPDPDANIPGLDQLNQLQPAMNSFKIRNQHQRKREERREARAAERVMVPSMMNQPPSMFDVVFEASTM